MTAGEDVELSALRHRYVRLRQLQATRIGVELPAWEVLPDMWALSAETLTELCRDLEGWLAANAATE